MDHDNSQLDTLPKDLEAVGAAAATAHALGIDTVDSIIERLSRAREQVLAGQEPTVLGPLQGFVKMGNGKVASGYKEWATAVNRFGKGVDKKFGAPIPPVFPPPPAPTPTETQLGSDLPPQPTTFGSALAVASLNETIALHLARIGAFNSLSTFLEESNTPSPPLALLSSLSHLHSILSQLRQGICTLALAWVSAYDSFAADSLKFELRKEEFIHLLLAPPSPHSLPHLQTQFALAYAGEHFRSFLTPTRATTICALVTSPLYMPLPRLLASPYASLFEPYVPPPGGGPSMAEIRIQALFTEAYLKTLDLPRDSPLSVVTDIGGGGALARIMKVRTVMKEKRTEWSAVGELPVEIPLSGKHRYHSIFACPVSKEQSTANNPPMLLPCGHVIARESLVKLARGSTTLKCPYCPVILHIQAAHRVHF